MAWTDPTTAATGDVLTASRWNQEVQANGMELAPFFAAWTSWTPTISQNGTRTITNTQSRYLKVGRLVIGQVLATITNAGTSANAVRCTLPVSPATTNGVPVGTFDYWVGSTTRYIGAAFWENSASAVSFDSGGTNNILGISPSFAVANNDVLRVLFMYEAAS